MMGSDYISEGGRAETNIEVSRGMAAERVEGGLGAGNLLIKGIIKHTQTHTHTCAHAQR